MANGMDLRNLGGRRSGKMTVPFTRGGSGGSRTNPHGAQRRACGCHNQGQQYRQANARCLPTSLSPLRSVFHLYVSYATRLKPLRQRSRPVPSFTGRTWLGGANCPATFIILEISSNLMRSRRIRCSLLKRSQTGGPSDEI